MESATRDARPAVGVSACLLGQPVRFDGGHKRNTFLVQELGQWTRFVPYCPETAIGLGVPRPPIRLVGRDPASARAVGVRDGSIDVTDALAVYAESVLPSAQRLDGLILKKDSPSCGMERVRLYPAGGGAATRHGVGVFARILQCRLPELPLEEEGRLNDPVLRENFVNRLYVHHRFRGLVDSGLTRRRLIDFHTRHKYLVMAHSTAGYQRLGRMLSNLAGDRLQQVAPGYFAELMQVLKRRVTRKRHYNVMQHILGYLKNHIDGADKTELLDAMARYKDEEVPLVVPITRFRHYFRKHPDPYIEAQVYLAPHPDGLRLRNHV